MIPQSACPIHGNDKRRRFLTSFLVSIVILFTGCKPVQSSTPEVKPSQAPSHTVTAQPSATFTQTPEPSLSPDASALISTPFITAESTNGPLRFVFPTQEARPISAWRPPLYAIPFAMTPHDHFYFARPIGADEVNWPDASYRYGAPWPGLNNVFHTGIDIEAPTGTPVLAAAPGEVVWAGIGLQYGPGIPNDPYGMAVAISHDFGYQGKKIQTIYAHMSEVDVVVGQHLNTGDQIGLVGDTGLTTGPHLHFEVRLEEDNFFTTRNPELWLAPPQGWGVLVGRLTDGFGNKIHALEVIIKSGQNNQVWIANTYATEQMVKSDAYYRENLVLSDLPAGKYSISLNYQGSLYKQIIQINPGVVSYFTFEGTSKFSTSLPPTPEPDFVWTPTKTP